MKTMNATILIAAGLFVTTAAANAEQRLRVDVPFQFQVGKTVLPAGEYSLDMDTVHSRAGLFKVGGGAGAYLGAYIPLDPNAAHVKGSLVFHCYGDTHFLRDVWTAGGAYGLTLPESATERDARKAGQERRVALLVSR